MSVVMKREFKSYFNNMMGYVIIAGTLLLVAVYFFNTNLTAGYPKFEYTLSEASGFLFSVIIPLLTMRSFADERRLKTDQLLLTSPLSVSDIVLGKYFGTLAVFGVAMLLMLPYPFILDIMGDVNYLTAFSGMLGYFLLSAALTAIGIFMSSLTESQIISAVISLCTMLLLSSTSLFIAKLPISALINYGILTALAIGLTLLVYFLTKSFVIGGIFAVITEGLLIVLYRAAPAVLEGSVAKLLGYISIFDRMKNFIYGMFDIPSLVYYITVAALFVFLTVQSIEKRRWS